LEDAYRPLQLWHRIDTHFSKEERQIFDAYIFMVLGDGSSALDRWLDG
jgi:hypothetical protein